MTRKLKKKIIINRKLKISSASEIYACMRTWKTLNDSDKVMHTGIVMRCVHAWMHAFTAQIVWRNCVALRLV